MPWPTSACNLSVHQYPNVSKCSNKIMFTNCISICRFPISFGWFFRCPCCMIPITSFFTHRVSRVCMSCLRRFEYFDTGRDPTRASQCNPLTKHARLWLCFSSISRLSFRSLASYLDSGRVVVHMSRPVRTSWISSWHSSETWVGATSRGWWIKYDDGLMLGLRQTQDVGPCGCRTKIPARRSGKCSEKCWKEWGRETTFWTGGASKCWGD